MGCGASREPRRPSDTYRDTDDGHDADDRTRLGSSFAPASSTSPGNPPSSFPGADRSLDLSSVGSPGTSSKPAAPATAPMHTITDSRGFRVQSFLSSRSKVDGIVRWADAVLAHRAAQGGSWPNPQLLSRVLKRPVEEASPKGAQMPPQASSSVSLAPSNSSLATPASTTFLSPSSPLPRTVSDAGTAGRSAAGGASVAVHAPGDSEDGRADQSLSIAPRTPAEVREPQTSPPQQQRVEKEEGEEKEGMGQPPTAASIVLADDQTTPRRRRPNLPDEGDPLGGALPRPIFAAGGGGGVVGGSSGAPPVSPTAKTAQPADYDNSVRSPLAPLLHEDTAPPSAFEPSHLTAHGENDGGSADR